MKTLIALAAAALFAAPAGAAGAEEAPRTRLFTHKFPTLLKLKSFGL